MKISEPQLPISDQSEMPKNGQSDESPAEDNQAEAVPFPDHCLPEVMRRMVNEAARVTTAQNLELAAVTAMATVSAAAGAGIQVRTGGERRVRPNIFACVIAPSGTGKGENEGIFCSPLDAIESDYIRDFEENLKPGLVAQLKVSSERLKRQVNIAAKETDNNARNMETDRCKELQEEVAELRRKLDACPKIRVSDTTKEALAIRLQGQPGEALASITSEARGVMAIVGGKYSKDGGDEDIYCSGYSGDSISVDRVSRESVRLNWPCLVVLWMVQPDAARAALSKESFTESGLLPRFLIFDAQAEPKIQDKPPEPIDSEVNAAWDDLIRTLVENIRMMGATPAEAVVSDDASKILHEYENQNIRRRQKDGDLRDLAPYVARWAENAWRIALILHCARNPAEASSTPLEASTASNAVEIMGWFSDQQLEVLQEGRREKLRGRLSSLLAVLRDENGEITMRDLSRSHGFKKEEVEHLYSFFPHQIIIKKHKGKTGRPSVKVFLPASLPES